MKYFVSFILLLFILFRVDLRAQDVQVVSLADDDTTQMVVVAEQALQKHETFKPNPSKAVIFSAIFPGLGQIYNRKYWKLPIVYGGFLGCVYAVTWNGTQYNGYKNAYNDFTDNNKNTNAWHDFVYYRWKKDMENWQDAEAWPSDRVTYFSKVLKNGKDVYRRNRDLSYIVTIGVYALCMIDAYVDAQLFDFDISPDLSFRFEPVLIPQTMTNTRSFGLQCSLTF